jgi:hypothetical protein
MKIHPPKHEINPHNPFEHALYNREAFAKTLTSIVRSTEDGMVLFVDAPWGEGKTTFAKMWIASLGEKEKQSAIYFDAFECDYMDDPFVAFSGEILEKTQIFVSGAEGAKWGNLRTNMRSAAGQLGVRLVGAMAKQAIKTVSLGIVDDEALKGAIEAARDVLGDSAEKSAEAFALRIDEYAKGRQELKQFRDALEALALQYRAEHGFPLTIFIDELDRCRPTFALNLLERIKHVFGVKGVAFVLLVNQAQLEENIRCVYGAGVDAKSYLLKFADVLMPLPTGQPSYQHIRGRGEYALQLAEWHGLNHGQIANAACLIAELLSPTLRQTEKAVQLLTFFYSSRRHEAPVFFVTLLAFLKIVDPKTYGETLRGTISDDQFIHASKLDQLKDGGANFSSEHELAHARYYLGSDETATEVGAQWRHLSGPLQASRKDRLPKICRHLDQFVLS